MWGGWALLKKKKKKKKKNCFNGSGVAQLVEQLLLTPEVRGSNPVLSKFYYLLSVNCNEKTQMKKK